MIRLGSNADLHNYLTHLAARIDDTSAAPLALHLSFAARQATGLSTEFLGESLAALQEVLDAENGVLTSSERDDLMDVIGQVALAIKR